MMSPPAKFEVDPISSLSAMRGNYSANHKSGNGEDLVAFTGQVSVTILTFGKAYTRAIVCIIWGDLPKNEQICWYLKLYLWM